MLLLLWVRANNYATPFIYMLTYIHIYMPKFAACGVMLLLLLLFVIELKSWSLGWLAHELLG